MASICLAPSLAIAQSATQDEPDLVAYQIATSYSGTQTLNARGQLAQSPGNFVNIDLIELYATDVSGEYAPGDTVSFQATVIEEIENGVFVDIPEIGLCGFLLNRGPFLACQRPPSGGQRALNPLEVKWTSWSADRINDFLNAMEVATADERANVAGIIASLPSAGVADFVTELEAELGPAAQVVRNARATWEQTQVLMAYNQIELSRDLVAAIDGQEHDEISSLLENGADPNSKTEDGQSVLAAAQRSGDVIAVAKLLTHGADPAESIATDQIATDSTQNQEIARLLSVASALHAQMNRARARIDELANQQSDTNELLAEVKRLQAALGDMQTLLDRAESEATAARIEAEQLKSNLNNALAATEAREATTQASQSDPDANGGSSPGSPVTATDIDSDVATHEVAFDALLGAIDPIAPASVRFVQSRLNALGFDAGPADGQIGRRTRQAAAAFRKANAMGESPEVDLALVRALALAQPE